MNAEPDAMDVIAAGVTELLHAHGLAVQGWRFKWDRATQRAGACHYRKKTITMSWPIFSHSEAARAEWRNTALHEIAHALVPHGSAHGPEWRRVARAIGCTGARCHTYDTPPRPIVGLCSPACPSNTKRDRARFPKAGLVYRCRRCRANIRWMDRVTYEATFGPTEKARDKVAGMIDGSQDTPAAPRGTQPRRKDMSDTDTKTKAEATAPKPGRGYTVVELRTPKQAQVVKSAIKGFTNEVIRAEDRWVVLRNTDAQTVVDKAIASADKLSMFEGRVVTYFLAIVLLGNDKVTDTRTSLHSRLISVGRATKDFGFTMKSDGTIGVTVGKTEYATQKAAMEALAPDQLKAPKTTSDGTDVDKAAAAAKLDDLATAKAEAKALKEWEAADEATRGARPITDTLDAKNAAYAAKQAKKAADVAERAEVEPNFKKATKAVAKAS